MASTTRTSTSTSAAQTSAPPFRKVLYLRSQQLTYPDNYVDQSFLQSLQRNVNVHPTPLSSLLIQTLPITQHLASLILFISIFIRLSSPSTAATSLSPSTLLGASFALSLLCRFLSPSPSPSPTPGGGHGHGHVLGLNPIPTFTLYLLSPALSTLSAPFASDSIWALSGLLFALNLLLGDYRAIPDKFSSPARREGSGTLPLTAALSASTVLASRLAEDGGNLAVFALLAFSTTWFGTFPLLRSSLPLRPSIALTLLLVFGSLGSLRGVAGRGVTMAAAACMFGVGVAAPVGRGVAGGRWKDKVRGPWDLAVPRVH